MDSWVVIGIDNGATKNNTTVLDSAGAFLIDSLLESPSRVDEGPEVAVEALAESFNRVVSLVGVAHGSVRAVGLDTPGPASADGVISSRGATNFSQEPWRGFDIRTALETRLGLPVIYNNDGNVAGLYAHDVFFGPGAKQNSSVSAVVGTGLGGGVVVDGRVVKGSAGMAGELGHVHIPMEGLLGPDQPVPRCNCGFVGDVESIASLRGIETNLLPYWLSRYPDHELGRLPLGEAARLVRAYGEMGDEMARAIFAQQAQAIGRLFTIASNFLDPNAYFVGGGVVEAAEEFRLWFLETVRAATQLRAEQAEVVAFSLVPDLDMAGARGAALAARAATEAAV